MIDPTDSDARIMTQLGARLARHRLDMQLTQRQLADEAGLSKRTVERLEAGTSVQLPSLVRVLRVLMLLPNLDALVPEPLPSPLRETPRQRARRRSAVAPAAWSWRDEAEDQADHRAEARAGDEAGDQASDQASDDRGVEPW